MGADTRQRLLDATLELCGAKGFARTTVAEIERAAGLSGGSGGLYRHFRSKDELLVEAVRSRVANPTDERFVSTSFSAADYILDHHPGGSLDYWIAALCRLGLARADHLRDVRRVLLRDNTVPVGLLAPFRSADHESLVVSTVDALRRFAVASGIRIPQSHGWRPVAEVLVGAMTNLWSLGDMADQAHTGGVAETVGTEAYIRALSEALSARIEQVGDRR